jgi:hypothetical protein
MAVTKKPTERPAGGGNDVHVHRAAGVDLKSAVELLARADGLGHQGDGPQRL